ncbi:Heterokaryon incompatibility protein 6, OR allele [Madurella mycetomatis]|uniref:Heterokaryon incompatibility protein 6, OR allele n=1 Tax=Madurella mycetomatis TaxID=100816 RepID=A0A175W2P5_9PEZI|nr:Heterokaryon incompatibility protein 6, OR allele [Madurella mycetomatis]
MDGSPSASVYRPLDPSRREIRLLELLATAPGDKVYASCRLTTVSLDEKPRFMALSYVWGKPSVTDTILLNGVKRQVTKNLAAALRCLTPGVQKNQRTGTNSRLWIDALCINQDDIPERNHQVSLMGELYSSATGVFSWLGTDPLVHTAIKTLVTISKEVQNVNGDADRLENLDWLRHHPDLYAKDDRLSRELIPNRCWTALHDFAHLAYWSRMWIFQEIVLSKPGMLIFLSPEGLKMPEYQLASALGCVRLIAQCVSGKPCPDFVSGDMWNHLQRLPDLANAAKQVQGLLVAKKNLGKAAGGDRAALCILSAFNHETKATDPRDFYYSLLGAAKLSLMPDYSAKKSVQQVCLDFVRAYLDVTRAPPWALLFLHDAVGPKDAGQHGLPSWAPGYHLPMTNRLRGPDDKARADQGVFDKLAETARPMPALTPQNRTLRVLGVRGASVSFVSYRPSFEFLRTGAMKTYLLDFSRRHGPTYRTGIPAATALFATLLRKIDGQYDFLKGLIFLEAIIAGDSDSAAVLDAEGERTWQGIRRAYASSAPRKFPSDIDLESLQVAVRVEWVRTLTNFERLNIGRLFETEEGYLGLAPLDVSAGDVVCVLDGFQYPVVLRPAVDKYIFVGACFVLGFMTGEMRTVLEDGQPGPEVFELE